jgi:molybdate transport system substrate-binding protein
MKRIFLSLVAIFAACSSPAPAAEISVMSGGVPKDVLAVLVPQFEKNTGHHVTLNYVLVSSLRQKILSGEPADMVILPTTAIENLIAARKIAPDGRELFGTVKLVAVVRRGAPQPDIASVEAFRAALLNAKSIVYSTPGSTQSGAHMANMVSQLDIADAVERKAIYRPALEGGVTMVADGKADIGIYPASEVVAVEGVTSIGALPEALQYSLLYGGAVTTTNKSPEPALSLIKYLSAPENRGVWQHAGFEPPK